MARGKKENATTNKGASTVNRKQRLARRLRKLNCKLDFEWKNRKWPKQANKVDRWLLFAVRWRNCLRRFHGRAFFFKRSDPGAVYRTIGNERD